MQDFRVRQRKYYASTGTEDTRTFTWMDVATERMQLLDITCFLNSQAKLRLLKVKVDLKQLIKSVGTDGEVKREEKRDKINCSCLRLRIISGNRNWFFIGQQ
jgi:hypothetical protein